MPTTDRTKLIAALSEVMDLIQQHQAFAGAIVVRVVFCLRTGQVSLDGSATWADVTHENRLVEIFGGSLQ